MRRIAKHWMVGLLGGTLSSAAFTQSAQPADTAPKTDLLRQGGTLSDKLSTANGVIRPLDPVDPKMQKPAPAMGTMPVIPPPGAPGGATDVQPK